MAKSDTAERKDTAKRGQSAAKETEKKGLSGFLSSTMDELDKVIWPSRQQLLSESAGVLLIVVAFASFIFLIDKLFGWLSATVF